MDLALNNLQRLIYHKIQKNNQPTFMHWGKICSKMSTAVPVFSEITVVLVIF